MPRQIANKLTGNLGLVPVVVTASADETGVNCKGYQEVLYVLHCGAVTALTSLDVKIQESATQGGTYADISGGAFSQVTAANEVNALSVRVNPAKPWQRISHTLVGTNILFGVARFLGESDLQPGTPKAT